MLGRKKMRLKICVYCGRTADTHDHVVPRCLLERPFPLNLLTVDSCQLCNSDYSLDEEYFLAVIASSGFVRSLTAKVRENGVVDRMLSRKPHLDDLITDALHLDEGGRVFLRVQEKRVARVVQKVAFGMYLHRYRPSRIPQLSEFRVWPVAHAENSINAINVMTHNERFRSRRWIAFQRGVFDYMFARNWIWADFGKLVCIMKFHETVWAAVSCPEWPRGPGSTRRKRVGKKQFRLYAP